MPTAHDPAMATGYRVPPTPDHARLVHPDGTVIPLELIHAGWEGQIAVWENAYPVATPPEGTELRTRHRPANCVIRLVAVDPCD